MAESEVKKDLTEGADRKPDVIHKRRPKKVISYEIAGRQIHFHTENNIELRLTIHTPNIIQLEYLLEESNPDEFSYALDPGFNPEEADFDLDVKKKYFEITTSSLLCRVAKKDLKVDFYDSDGNVLCKDHKSFYRRDTLMKGITEIRIEKEAPPEQTFYGMGDKITEEGLRGNKFENWNTDSYAYEFDDWNDPLYRTIPFYAALLEGRAYGIFMDNTYRSFFDFDSKGNNTSSFSANGGKMNYYFIYGPELSTVTERYTKLTGTPEMPPLWAFGYHQCKWSYYPEAQVRDLADTFREKEIPCDAIYLDIDYMDEYRCFTWDSDYFPQPQKMIADLKEQGFETIVMIDPGIKVDQQYGVYKSGVDQDVFCRRPDGELMTGPVWPPKVAFPDYTNPKVRDWWAELYRPLMEETGVSGVWNDMNEPAMFEVESKTIPEDVRHYYEGLRASHKKVHNVYGMQMARASLEGIKKYNKGKRPFLLTRANYAGGQRYAALWTGDNIANWEHLRLANQQCQRLSVSGYSFVGSDIGGFVENPSGELFSRWLQLGIFHPLFRNHSMGYNVDGAAAVQKEEVALQKMKNEKDQEPWTFGDKFTEINRSIIELRYRLLPYLYTAFRRYQQDGTPILQPLGYYDQQDPKAIKEEDEFIFGGQILVSPVLKKNKRTVKTYFPKGRWYDFRTKKQYDGKSSQAIDAPLSKIPFFIREGTVLPLREVMQYTRERNPDYLELQVYVGPEENQSTLYEDAEEGYAYKEGDYRLTTYTLTPKSDEHIILSADREGPFTPAYQEIRMKIIGMNFTPSEIRVDGSAANFTTEDSPGGTIYTLTISPDFQQLTIKK